MERIRQVMIKKSFPIKEPYLYDTKRGIDHFTKLMIEENPNKLSPKEIADINKLNKDMKRAALKHHVSNVKPFDGLDVKTYPSQPEVRGRLMEIEKLEKDLNLAPPKLADLPIIKNNINNTKLRRNYFDDTVKLNVGNKGPLKLPKLTPEEIERANRPSDWDVIYKSMTPFEKGQWNSEQRRKESQRKKEEAAEELTAAKMATEVVEHINPRSSVVPGQKSDNYYTGAISAEDSISNMPVEHAIRPMKHEPGLSENFVKEKFAEAKIMKDVLGE